MRTSAAGDRALALTAMPPVSSRDAADRTLAELIDDAADNYGDSVALRDVHGQTLTFVGLSAAVGRFRTKLKAAGVRPGDHVGLRMQNSLLYSVAWLAVATSGSTAVPINKRLGLIDGAFLLSNSRTSFVVADPTTLAAVEQARSHAGLTSLQILTVESTNPATYFEDEAETAPAGELNPRSIANIQYTSGSTGFPKGCLLSHSYWARMGVAATATFGLDPDDRVITAQPHSYVDPQWNVVATLVSGATLTIADGFHPSTFMATVAMAGITVFYCLGVMPTMLMKQPVSEDDSSHRLRAVYCSAIPRARHADIEARWGVPWYDAFGMTETGFNTVVNARDHDGLVGTGSIGLPLPHCEAAVVDDEGRAVPDLQAGQMWLRGLGFMDGYYQDAESTAEFFRNGWSQTGDRVTRDRNGQLFYQGRIKEFIRRAAENIAPAEIEDCIATHPAVLECAVRGVPDPDVEEEIKAYIVTRPGSSLAVSELAEYLGPRLGSFKVPRYYEFRTELPHTPSERVAKGELERGRTSWQQDTIDIKHVRSS